MSDRPDIVVLMTDEERAVPPYESSEVVAWRDQTLAAAGGSSSTASVSAGTTPARWPACPVVRRCSPGTIRICTGVTQTDGIGKTLDDSRMRWLRPGEVSTLGNWLRAADYDTHYDGKWHISRADLHDADGKVLATNDGDGIVDPAAVQRYLSADPLAAFGFSG